MEKGKIFLVVCILLTALNIILWINPKKNYYGESIYLNVDSVESINDSLRNISIKLCSIIDSLEKEKDKIDSNIVRIEVIYEKELIDIVNQSISSDAMFFSNYLSKDSTRFFDSNNSESIKTY